jgi:serine/threonine-protein kinase
VRRPRHEGDSLVQVLASAFESKPIAYGPEVPVELAAICNKATAQKAEDRYPSAEALSEAVGAFLRHRHSAQLTQAAQRHLAQLVADMLVIGLTPATRAARVQSTFAACRFGFEQALVEWPDNVTAATGLQQAFERMLEHELLNENVAAARGLYGQLTQKRPDLFERIEALERKLAERKRRLETLEQLEASSDLNLALQERSWLVALSGVLYSALGLLAAYLEHRGVFTFTNTHAVMGILLFTVLNYAGTAFLWFKTKINDAQRRLLLANIAATAGGAGFWLISWIGELHFQYALAEYMLLTATNWAVMTVLYDRRGVVTTVSFLSVAVLGVIWPQWVLIWFALGTSAGFFGLAWMWSRKRVPPGSTKPSRTLVDDDAPTLPGL